MKYKSFLTLNAKQLK